MTASYRPAMIEDSYALLPIGDNAENGVILVDLSDIWLEQYTWVKHNMGYAKACIDGKEVSIHRYLMRPADSMTVDHINGNKLDNRRSNLRICTLADNNLNKPAMPHSKQMYKGIEFMPKLNAYRARIRYQGKRYSLGCFKTAEAARDAYNAKASELFKDFAYTKV